MAEFISQTSPPQITSATALVSSGSFNLRDVMQVGMGSAVTAKVEMALQPNLQSIAFADVCAFTTITPSAKGPVTTIAFGQMAVTGIPVAQGTAVDQTPVQYWS